MTNDKGRGVILQTKRAQSLKKIARYSARMPRWVWACTIVSLATTGRCICDALLSSSLCLPSKNVLSKHLQSWP